MFTGAFAIILSNKMGKLKELNKPKASISTETRGWILKEGSFSGVEVSLSSHTSSPSHSVRGSTHLVSSQTSNLHHLLVFLWVQAFPLLCPILPLAASCCICGILLAQPSVHRAKEHPFDLTYPNNEQMVLGPLFWCTCHYAYGKL